MPIGTTSSTSLMVSSPCERRRTGLPRIQILMTIEVRESLVLGRDFTVLLRADRWPTYTKLAHPVYQRRSPHAQALGGTMPSSDYPIARFQCPEDIIPL